jgi:hypothetical protein
MPRQADTNLGVKLKECKGVDWIQLAYNKYQYLVLGNTVIKLGSIKFEEFI